VKEEITTVEKGASFQDFSEDDIVELLESHSVMLMHRKLTEVDRQTYKEAQDNHDESVISEENSWKIKRFRRHLQHS
jgi:hypothetical protein